MGVNLIEVNIYSTLKVVSGTCTVEFGFLNCLFFLIRYNLQIIIMQKMEKPNI